MFLRGFSLARRYGSGTWPVYPVFRETAAAPTEIRPLDLPLHFFAHFGPGAAPPPSFGAPRPGLRATVIAARMRSPLSNGGKVCRKLDDWFHRDMSRHSDALSWFFLVSLALEKSVEIFFLLGIESCFPGSEKLGIHHETKNLWKSHWVCLKNWEFFFLLPPRSFCPILGLMQTSAKAREWIRIRSRVEVTVFKIRIFGRF